MDHIAQLLSAAQTNLDTFGDQTEGHSLPPDQLLACSIACSLLAIAAQLRSGVIDVAIHEP